MSRSAQRVWCAGMFLVACSSDVDQGRRCSEDRALCTTTAPSAGAAGFAGFAGTSMDMSGNGGAGSGGAGSGRGVVGNVNALGVRVQDIRKMTIEIITLACAGDCADIEAVAQGGNAPYTFAWEDGSTSASRHVCLEASTTLRVSATDTAITDIEFGYHPHTASADVTASVLAKCSDAGVPPAPGKFCIVNPSLEGMNGTNPIGAVPLNWKVCVDSPDVQPNSQTSGLPASDGATYEGFGTIGGLYESPGTAFCAPTEAGQPVSFSVDITMSSFFFGEPGALQLWGGMDSCGLDELLWTSPVINNVDSWQTYCGTMLPSKSFSYLTLVYSPGATPGYILVDNFRPATRCD